jgi:hypothetical protein
MREQATKNGTTKMTTKPTATELAEALRIESQLRPSVYTPTGLNLRTPAEFNEAKSPAYNEALATIAKANAPDAFQAIRDEVAVLKDRTPIATMTGLGKRQMEVFDVRFLSGSDDPLAHESITITGPGSINIYSLETFWSVMSNALDITSGWDHSDPADRAEHNATAAIWRRLRKLIGPESTIYNYDPPKEG